VDLLGLVWVTLRRVEGFLAGAVRDRGDRRVSLRTRTYVCAVELDLSAGPLRTQAAGGPTQPSDALIDWHRHQPIGEGDVRRWVAIAAAGVLLLAGCGGHGSAQIRVRIAAASALFDAPLGVTITGLPASRHVTVNATAGDYAGHTWKSSATYLPDSTGTLDPAITAPITGDYTGAQDTGLLWSMTTPDGSFYAPTTDLVTVHLTVSLNGRLVAAASLIRQMRADGVTERLTSVSREGFDGALFTPRDTATRRPAVLAFGGSEGGVVSGIAIARALASKGYPALGIGYFHAPGLPDVLTRIPLDYFATALRWLASQPGVDSRRIDVYGESRGSEAALLLGAHFPDLVFGVIAGSPSSVVNAGLPDTTQPAWTLHGQPIPGVSQAELGDPRPAGDPAAIIPVERIPGPVFLVCGQDDQLWPSCPYADAIASRLGAHPHTELREPGAGHYVGYPTPDLPIMPSSGSGGNQQADALGRLDAWPKLLGFLAAQGPR
jgi:dienelactone hydrolase